MSATITRSRFSLWACQNSLRNYAVNFSFMVTCLGMIWTFLPIGVTSIEKRYSLSSTQSGFIFSAAEIGRIPMLVFVSHFGNRFSTPKILALSGIGVSLSNLVMLLPHFLFSPATLATRSDSHNNYCMNYSFANNSEQNSTDITTAVNTQAYGMIVAGMVMLGIFLSPLTSLSMSYIDNNAKEGSAPIYIGLVQTSSAIGPIIATFLGAYFISIYVDLSDTTLAPEDPAWVGAWWLMMLTCCVTGLCTAPFMACYPRSIKKERQPSNSVELSQYRKRHDPDVLTRFTWATNIETTDARPNIQGDPTDANEEEKTTYTIKNLPLSIYRIVTNPIFLAIMINNVLRDMADVGFSSYLPKYMENMFGMPAWRASIYSGMRNVIASPGFFLGSVVITKLRLSYLSTIKFVVLASIAMIVTNVVLMFVGCENTGVVGDITSDRRSLSVAPCVGECVCSLEVYSPLCAVGSNATYFSPCHAGCPVPIAGNITQSLSSCGCASVGEVFKQGSCGECGTEKLIIYLIFLYLYVFSFSLCMIPCLSVLLRCVEVRDKALMLGLLILFIALLSWMPSTIIYGRVIDMTCSLWQTVGDSRGACWLYDRDLLRLSAFGLNIAIHTLAFFSIVASWFIASRRQMTWTTITNDPNKPKD